MALQIIEILAGLLLGNFLYRRVLKQRPKLFLLLGSAIILVGFLAPLLIHTLAPALMFIVFLGVPAFSEGIWLLSESKRNRKQNKPAA
jgi:uncharacterized membrane protein HdeD (DUF308 family)